jgi:hypothetical protein
MPWVEMLVLRIRSTPVCRSDDVSATVRHFRGDFACGRKAQKEFYQGLSWDGGRPRSNPQSLN